MTYTDTAFLFVLFPIAIILYNLMPKKGRGTALLVLSYAFFFIISRKLIVYILASTFIIWLYSFIIKRIQKKRSTNRLTRWKNRSNKIPKGYTSL